MGGKPYERRVQRERRENREGLVAFADALREVLGLGPLFGAEPPRRLRTYAERIEDGRPSSGGVMVRFSDDLLREP